MLSKLPEFEFRGIPKITIPKTDNDFRAKDFGKSIIEKYLPSILNKHSKNRDKIEYYHNYALGEQDITKKERLYEKDSKNNNKIAENHAYRQTTFKVAFVSSERRDYAHKSDSHCDDIKYLDRYFTDVDFFAKDKNVKEWIYQTGIGVTYQCPRTDIIVEENKKYRYLGKNDGYDIETQAPFEFDDLDPRDNFVVYSSVRGNKPLFCVSLVQVEKDNIAGINVEYEYKVYIETRYARFIAKCSTTFTNAKDIEFEMKKSFASMPMVEHCVNNARIGIVELNRDLFNCTNILVSNVIDMIVDGANIIMVFKNTDIDQETINEMKQKGALILNDNPESKSNNEAKLETITLQINFEGLNSFYEERLTQAYDIAGVPLASGTVTSGGDTGQARLLGGGWENAYTIIKNDITTLLKGDYDVLKGILAICKDIPNCPIKTITASQIDIKYHINQSDNLLTKAQSIAQLYQINMPKEEILKVTGLFSDICTVATKWQKSDDDAREKSNKESARQPTDIVGGKDTSISQNNGNDTNVATKNKSGNSSKE